LAKKNRIRAKTKVNKMLQKLEKRSENYPRAKTLQKLQKRSENYPRAKTEVNKML